MPTSTIPAGGGGGLAPKYQKFTSSGTFTLPDGYGAAKPLLVTIQIIGGGGAGSGNFSTTNNGIKIGEVTSNNYFGNGTVVTINASAASFDGNNTSGGRGGGSGGIAATQMYLTSNLTLTVGAAGSRTVGSYAHVGSNTRFWNDNGWGSSNNRTILTYGPFTGGTGGITTAGSVSASGGTGGTIYYTMRVEGNNGNTPLSTIAKGTESTSAGSGGTPSGTAGEATPLLGTLAGGSTSNTPIYGSFGIGGIRSDAGTSTGVEGTGGGQGSIGAPGAVIITYWA